MLPKYLPLDLQRVVQVDFVRERVYPCNDQVLHDYYLIFEDGTADCMSYTPIQGPPTVGEKVSRAIARLGGDFVRWGETRSVGSR